MPACLASLFIFLGFGTTWAQVADTSTHDTTSTKKSFYSGSTIKWTFEPTAHEFIPPYAGKIEARIGGSRESENDKLRLDIGGTLDIMRGKEYPGSSPVDDLILLPFSMLTLGADFFTWTRLRANENFKFPVEAVDYYFGLNATSDLPELLLPRGFFFGSNVRLRIAHISAHLVDGDPSFTDPQQQYMTYSREFADLMLALYRNNREPYEKELNGFWRLYAGAVWLFHTIPDTLGVLTPYAGFDGEWQLWESFPLTLKLGYEARLNTELEPIGEHLARVGLKLGKVNSRGVLLEGSYYTGRSPYGQHFSQRERFFSVGFAVDY
jgi:hypothetical protein